MTTAKTGSTDWVRYNQLTDTYDTPDGTKVAAELVDNVACLADFLHIAKIRDDQRATIKESRLAPPQRFGQSE